MMLSPDVLGLLSSLLAQVTLQAGADDFEESALLVIKAKREVAAALTDPELPRAPDPSRPAGRI